jgi:hypothetical protein
MTGNKIKKTCFVVGPIGEDGSVTRKAADWLLKGIIRPVFDETFQDFEVIRSDTITAPGMIDVQMINHLLDADLVIADMSERNPNAFYEMGIRHMAQRPIVHMFSEGTVIPFDVAPYRAIKFSLETFDLLQRAKEELRAVVREVLKPGYTVENPVTRARGVQAIEQKAPPEIQFLYEEVAAIRRRLDGGSADGEIAALLGDPEAMNRQFVSFHIRLEPEASWVDIATKLRKGPFTIQDTVRPVSAMSNLHRLNVFCESPSRASAFIRDIPGVQSVHMPKRPQ